ncbi:MAG: hypothetical protein IKR25_12660 [Muribaculaceae bacterium]|nr:hypothetical protein [Muribaculaceae bacterium]
MKRLLSLLLAAALTLGFAAEARRCQHPTMRGTQCKREAKVNGYCTQHWKSINRSDEYKETARECFDSNGKPLKATSNADRCHATTKKGTRCKHKVIRGTRLCPQHTP